MSAQNTSRPRRAHRPGMMNVEKPKDFRGTIKKLIAFMEIGRAHV